MPTKDHVVEMTTTQLSRVCGVSFKTAVKRLDEAGLRPSRTDGRTAWWRTTPAARAILGRADPFAERSRLDAARADLAILELRRKCGELVEVADVERRLVGLVTSVRAQALAVAGKVAGRLSAEREPAACRAIVDAGIREALAELAAAGAEAERRALRRIRTER